MTPRAKLLLACIATTLSSACAPSPEWVPLRYGAPLTGDPVADAETNRCARECYDGASDASSFYQCLTLCPGISVDTAATCEDPAETQEAFCYTHWVQREGREAGDDGASVLGDVILGVFRVLLSAATSGDDGGRESEERGGHGERRQVAARSSAPSPRRATPPAERAPPRREYTPAQPRRR